LKGGDADLQTEVMMCDAINDLLLQYLTESVLRDFTNFAFPCLLTNLSLLGSDAEYWIERKNSAHSLRKKSLFQKTNLK
jgi:hypothetical protein